MIYHLKHPRAFLEYRSEFLTAAHSHPEYFEHLSLYHAAASGLSYIETDELRDGSYTPYALAYFYRQFRFAEKGTLSLWHQSLDQVHGNKSREQTFELWRRAGESQ